MTHVPLPDGQWAEFAAPQKVSERRRRSYVNAIAAFNAATAQLPRAATGDGPDPRFAGAAESELLDNAIDLLILALVKAWSYEQPVSLDALQDLPVDAYDVLRKEASDRQADMMPDYSPTTDPKAPTNGSLVSPTG